MIRWYVSYHAVGCDDSRKFGYVIVSTTHEYFPIRQVIEEIEEGNGFQEVVIINWKKIHEVEFLHHEGKFSGLRDQEI